MKGGVIGNLIRMISRKSVYIIAIPLILRRYFIYVYIFENSSVNISRKENVTAVVIIKRFYALYLSVDRDRHPVVRNADAAGVV